MSTLLTLAFREDLELGNISSAARVLGLEKFTALLH
jgi:hypothetical protein